MIVEVYDTSTDYRGGYEGGNLLGKALMQIRNEIRRGRG